jgi:PTH1 family peptidyl-tRNA hydrolase
MILDKLAQQLKMPPFQFQKKFQADLTKVDTIILMKPQTFMNDSGLAVRQVLSFYTDFGQVKSITPVTLPSLFVIHDDLDLETGSFKLHFGKGPKIHNGLLSLYQHLGTDQFWHVRVGVDGRAGDRSLSGRDYVLKPFSVVEKNALDQLAPEIVAAVLARLDTIQ